MKTTVSVSEAQAQLPKIIRADNIVGIMRHKELAAFIVPRERLESLLDTLDFLANPKARQAIARFKAGKMRFTPLRAVKRELAGKP